jgi:hypothetical protein
VLRRPDSRDGFELALGDDDDGGVARQLSIWCVCAARAMAAWRRDFVARHSRWRPVRAKRTAPSATSTTRRARRPDEAGCDTSPS